MKYLCKIWTGPTEVAQRAAYAREGVLTTVHEVREGTEHIYITLEAKTREQALAFAQEEAGYLVQAAGRWGDTARPFE